MSKQFVAVVGEELTLDYINPVRLKQELLSLKGKTVIVTIKRQVKKRSSEQNSYYWGVIIKYIADYCGYAGSDELESLHYELRKQFLANKGVFNVPKSTSELSSQEFNEYLENITRWASQTLGLYIPSPNEVEYER